MKKILLLIFSLVLALSSITTTKAYETDHYSYDYLNYSSTIEDIEAKDTYTQSNIVENNVDINLIIDNNLRYVTANGLNYTFDDFNSALEIQAIALYDNNISMTILEALESFTLINDLETYLQTCDNSVIIESTELNNKIFPNGYGTYYYLGIWKKVNVTVSLGSAALSALYTFFTSGHKFNLKKAVLKSFVSSFLISLGVDYVSTSAVYKKWQAVMNAHGTTKEKRQNGFKYPGKNNYKFDTKTYETTFETQRS